MSEDINKSKVYGFSFLSDPRYRELLLSDVRNQVTLTKLDKIPSKLKKSLFRFPDKRKKPIEVIKVPLAAAAEDTAQIPEQNLMDMSDPYPQVIRDAFNDTALTDPTACPGIKKRVKSFYANGYTLKLILKSARADDGHLLTDQEKQMMLQTYTQTYQQYLKKIEDWDNLTAIQTLKKMRTARHTSIVQGRFLIKIFPGFSKLPPGQMPVSLKAIPSEDTGSVIIDRIALQIVAVRVISFDDNIIVLPDEMIYGPVNDSGLKKSEMFYGRSELEPIFQLSKINKRIVNYEYAKAVIASYQPKVSHGMTVDGSPEEKDAQLKKRANDIASEGIDVLVYEADPNAKTEIISVNTNNEMMRDIRNDIDSLMISNVGTTKLQIGRIDGLTRDNATVGEIENIRNVRTPDENEFADFFESQLYNKLLAHLANTPLDQLPVKIIMVRNEPQDEASISEPGTKEDVSTDPLILQKGKETQIASIPQPDATGPMGAAETPK